MKEKTYFLKVKEVLFGGVIEMQMSEFSEELGALQEQVGGTIEHFIIDEKLNNRYIDMWIDDEGKLKNLMPTVLLMRNGEMLDYIAGPCVFTKYDDEGYTWGLHEEDMEAVRQFLYQLPVAQYTTIDGRYGYALVVDMKV